MNKEQALYEAPVIGASVNDIQFSKEQLDASAAKQKQDRIEDIIKARIERKIAREEKVKTGAIKSLDYSRIENEDFKNDFMALCQEWEERCLLKYNIDRCPAIKDKDVEAKCWGRFVMNAGNKYGFNIVDKKIVYNKDHYAVWGEDPIYIASDFQIKLGRGKLGKFSKTNGGKRGTMNADQLLDYYCNLFNVLCEGMSFDLMLWNTLRFFLLNVELKTYLQKTDWDIDNKNVLSPRLVYDKLVHHLSRNSKKKVKPLIKHRHQLLFLEPNFEVVAQEAYAIEMKTRKFDSIMRAINECNNNGIERHIDNIIFRIGLYKNSKKLGLKVISARTFKALYKEMEKDKQYGVYLKDEHFKIDLKKKQDTSVRKKQDRTRWHLLVEEGKTLKEVQEVFPNVSKSSYSMYKKKLRNTNTIL